MAEAELPRVAAVQMTSTADVERNLETARRLVREAAADGASLIVLPECFVSLGPGNAKLLVAEQLEPADGRGPILASLCELARELEADLILGGFWERGTTAARVRAANVHIDPGGEVRAIYRKIHLFDVNLPDGTMIRESDTIEPGTEVGAREHEI